MKKITSLFIGVFLLSWLPSIASTAEITYYHTDALGTPMAMTDSTGKVVWRGDYYPFGEEYLIEQTPEKNKRHFTGKEKDEESGLHYFGARYMDEASGRFVSPDPVTAVDPETSETNTALLGNPLRLNRYVYGLNNPHRYIDPDGNFPHDLNNPHNPYNLEDTGARYGGGSYSGKSFAKGLWGKITGKEVASKGGGRNLPFKDADRLTEVNKTLDRMESGGQFPHKKDGTIFKNKEGRLSEGNYREYTVDTPGARNRGARRIVQDTDTNKTYYTDDHYRNFTQIDPTKR